MTKAPPPLAKLCTCELAVWEYDDGTVTFASTPVQHLPHPSDDDLIAWADWYIVTEDMLADFGRAFAERVDAEMGVTA